MEKRDLYFVSMKNVWNKYILGRIMGILDVKANTAEDRHFRSWGIQIIDQDHYMYPIESERDLLNDTIKEINLFYPFVSVEIFDSKEIEES